MPQDALAPPPPSDANEAEEFARLPQRKRVRAPLVALAAALLAGYLLYRLHPDLSYALRAWGPVDLGDARAAARQLPAPNRYVTVEGKPDRSNAALLDTRGKDDFRQFFRLLGTDSRLLVLRTFGAIPTDRSLEDRFTGRLIAFSDLSYADAISDWFRDRVVATHLVDPKTFERALAQPNAELRDLAGDPVHLSDGSHLALDLIYPNEYQVSLPRSRFETAELAKLALAAVGFSGLRPGPLPIGLAPSDDTLLLVGRPFSHMRMQVIAALGQIDARVRVVQSPFDPADVYVAVPRSLYPAGFPQAVRALEARGFRGAELPPWIFIGSVAPARRDAALGQLDALRAGVRAEPHSATLEQTLAGLKAGRPIDFRRVVRVKLIEPLTIPADALVLVEGDAPQGHWYVPILYLLLGLFLGVNLYALWISLMRSAPKAAHS